MRREFAEGLRDFKQAVFKDIRQVIPVLENAFPDLAIVVRPHPTEDPKVYHDIADRCRRVKVTNGGNVIPWLMAARALVHNSCTTGVEAYIMGVPAATYMATRNAFYDEGYYGLPNGLSHRCFDAEGLKKTLGRILAGELGPAAGAGRRDLMAYYLTAQQGRLASERIVDVLESIADGMARRRPLALTDRLGRHVSGELAPVGQVVQIVCARIEIPARLSAAPLPGPHPGSTPPAAAAVSGGTGGPHGTDRHPDLRIHLPD